MITPQRIQFVTLAPGPVNSSEDIRCHPWLKLVETAPKASRGGGGGMVDIRAHPFRAEYSASPA
jgi:hypothetical protein